jgi:hypothetical protein
MNGTNNDFAIYTYYCDDSSTTYNVNSTQQESNLQTNRFAPLFANEEDCEAFKLDIDYDPFISKLYGEFHISYEDYDLLKQKKLRAGKTDLLVNILNNKLIESTTEQALDIINFIYNTLYSSQPFLAYGININETSFITAKNSAINTPINSRDIIKAMDKVKVETIEPLFSTQENYTLFKNDISDNIGNLASYLYGKDVLSVDEYDEFTQNIEKTQKTNMLINILNTKLKDPNVDSNGLITELTKALADPYSCNQRYLISYINSTLI